MRKRKCFDTIREAGALKAFFTIGLSWLLVSPGYEIEVEKLSQGKADIS
jgi:hypothetical protein